MEFMLGAWGGFFVGFVVGLVSAWLKIKDHKKIYD
jgi:hypothetical protein